MLIESIVTFLKDLGFDQIKQLSINLVSDHIKSFWDKEHKEIVFDNIKCFSGKTPEEKLEMIKNKKIELKQSKRILEELIKQQGINFANTQIPLDGNLEGRVNHLEQLTKLLQLKSDLAEVKEKLSSLKVLKRKQRIKKMFRSIGLNPKIFSRK